MYLTFMQKLWRYSYYGVVVISNVIVEVIKRLFLLQKAFTETIIMICSKVMGFRGQCVWV